MNQLTAGLLAGLGATAPMTVVMEALFTHLPEKDKYPLPPRQITEKLTEKLAETADVNDHMSQSTMKSVTMVNHFGYGAAAGAVYGALGEEFTSKPLSGVAFGLGLWTVSYMGWLPAANILPPATRMSAHRNVLMITAHVVWGLGLELGTRMLRESFGGEREGYGE